MMSYNAIYPGSFAPWHLGHQNIYDKACAIFGNVLIAQGVNKEKDPHPEYNIYNVKALMYANRIRYDGLLSDVLAKNYNPVVIRGLRSVTDVPEEMAFLRYMQDMVPNIQVVHIFCDSQFEHLSSRAIRNLVTYGKGEEYIVK